MVETRMYAMVDRMISRDQHYVPAGFSDTGVSAQEKYQQPGNNKMYRNENGVYPEESPYPDVGYCGS